MFMAILIGINFIVAKISRSQLIILLYPFLPNMIEMLYVYVNY